jgi:hypothetical protein
VAPTTDYREGVRCVPPDRGWTWHDVFPGVLLGVGFVALMALAVLALCGGLF